jgi:ribonucleoside-diphosphate reductase alpha chain
MEKQNGRISPSNIREEVLGQRYLKKDEQGNVIETPEQMFRRVANTIAAAEANYGAGDAEIESIADAFYQLMADGVFLPNSPTLMNAGREHSMLSACFVLPVEDSIDGIFDAVKNTALIQKAGGGTGFSFDRLRPTGDRVASSGGTTSGPISFWRVFSETTNAIQQGAFRRGANMGMMSVEHPDILKFICAKREPRTLTNFNISVKVPNVFMKRLFEDPAGLHVVVNPHTKREYVIPHSVDMSSYAIDDLLPAGQAEGGCYTTKEVWDMVIANAHARGEPGICFIDRVNKDNPTPGLGTIEATNPCGEQPLLPYEACNLGSINMAKFVLEDGTDLDWRSLAETVKLAVRFLDDVIDANHWPVPAIREMTLGNRKIGLGIMAFADTLILLGIRYDSEEAVQFAKRLSSFIQEHAHHASEELAKERGCFPNWPGSVWDTKYHKPLRNASCTTIAPTGSISIIAGCSSGIEPLFSVTTKRKILTDQVFVNLEPVVEKLGTRQGWLSEHVRNLLREGVPPKDIPNIPRTLSRVLVTAHEIGLEWHVGIQGALQQHVDNAVSKTVNLPERATVEDVDKVYRLAFELGCKGITVYRNGSDPDQVVTSFHEEVRPHTNFLSPRPRPRKTSGSTIKCRTGCGTLFISVNRDDKGLCEVFANLGKAGGCPSQSEATCRVLSAALRCGIDPGALIEQLKGIRCLSTVARRKTNRDIDALSCPDAIARTIEETLSRASESVKTTSINKCPECDHPLRKEEGCNICDNCAYRKCG